MAPAGRGVSAARLACAALLLAAVAGDGQAGAATATPPRPCAHVAVSPSFAQDGTVFCAGAVTSDGLTSLGPGLVVSSDRGRTWRAAPAAGLPREQSVAIDGLVVSPRYAVDRTIVLNLRFEGLYQSTDAGETFTPLLPGPVRGVSAFVSGVTVTGDIGAGRTVLLVPSGPAQLPLVVDTLTRTVQPVPGAPSVAMGAVVSPAWATDHTAVLFTHEGSATSTRVTAYGCSIAFECRTRLGSLPAGYTFDRAWPAADFATSGTLFVVARSSSGRPPRLYVSRDRGASFSLLARAQSLVDAHVEDAARDGEPVVSIATGRPGTDRVWLRVYGSPFASAPAAELYRSDDNGRSWVRVAYGRIAQKGSRGTMQDLRVPIGPQAGSLLAASADDVVFVNGITKGGWTASCSADRGRTWSTYCRG